jgi:hypothetical protein
MEKIPFVHEEITPHANKYKRRTIGHTNQLLNCLTNKTTYEDSKEYGQKT